MNNEVKAPSSLQTVNLSEQEIDKDLIVKENKNIKLVMVDFDQYE